LRIVNWIHTISSFDSACSDLVEEVEEPRGQATGWLRLLEELTANERFLYKAPGRIHNYCLLRFQFRVLVVREKKSTMTKQKEKAAGVAVCVLACGIAPIPAAEKRPLVVVRGPTVVAFFEPITQAELEKDPDANEALADFQFYAKSVREPLRQAGIEFHELYAHSFRLRVGRTLAEFRPIKAHVGYYLVAPCKKPRIEYGVMTDDDLLGVVKEYFGISAK